MPRATKAAATLPLTDAEEVFLVRILAEAPAALPGSGRGGAVWLFNDRAVAGTVPRELFYAREELAVNGSTIVRLDQNTYYEEFLDLLAGPGDG